jgi:hypothetical protein
LLDKYDTRAALALLEKDEDEFLRLFRAWCIPQCPITNIIEELHKIAVFRYLAEFVGARTNFQQHKIDLQHTANYNANICGSVVRINGSKPFGVFDSQEMLAALLKYPLFPAETLYTLDVVKWSTQMMGNLPIGYPNGYLV